MGVQAPEECTRTSGRLMKYKGRGLLIPLVRLHKPAGAHQPPEVCSLTIRFGGMHFHKQDRKEAFPALQRLPQAPNKCRSIRRGWGRRNAALSLSLPFHSEQENTNKQTTNCKAKHVNRIYSGLVSKFWNILHVNSPAGVPTIP